MSIPVIMLPDNSSIMEENFLLIEFLTTDLLSTFFEIIKANLLTLNPLLAVFRVKSEEEKTLGFISLTDLSRFSFFNIRS